MTGRKKTTAGELMQAWYEGLHFTIGAGRMQRGPGMASVTGVRLAEGMCTGATEHVDCGDPVLNVGLNVELQIRDTKSSPTSR